MKTGNSGQTLYTEGFGSSCHLYLRYVYIDKIDKQLLSLILIITAV